MRKGNETMSELTHLTLAEMRKMLDGRELSSFELTEAFLKEIESRDADIGAFLTVTESEAGKAAKSYDAAGEKTGVLSGIPMAIKDNICTKGIKTT